MEEWPCWGKTLERYDGSSPHYRCPVAFSQGLRDPATNLPTTVMPPLPSPTLKFSISLSAHIPYSQNAVLGCRPCIISLFSLIFLALSPCDTIRKFHLCQILIPDWPPLIRLNLKMSLMSLPAFTPRALFLWNFLFSLFTFSSIPTVYIRAVPLATDQKQIELRTTPPGMASWVLFKRAHEHEWHWPAHLAPTLHLVLQWGVFHSARSIFV